MVMIKLNNKKKISKIIIASLLIYTCFSIVSSNAYSKIISYSSEDKIIREEKIKIPYSNFGQYNVIGINDTSEKMSIKLFFSKLENIDFSKKYIILRDDNMRIVKAYNTDKLEYTQEDFLKDELNSKYILKDIVILNQKVNNIILTEKKIDKNDKNEEKENASVVLDKNNIVKLTIKFKMNDRVVSTKVFEVEKNTRPNINSITYEGEVYTFNNLIIPLVSENSSIIIPIDKQFDNSSSQDRVANADENNTINSEISNIRTVIRDEEYDISYKPLNILVEEPKVVRENKPRVNTKRNKEKKVIPKVTKKVNTLSNTKTKVSNNETHSSDVSIKEKPIENSVEVKIEDKKANVSDNTDSDTSIEIQKTNIGDVTDEN